MEGWIFPALSLPQCSGNVFISLLLQLLLGPLPNSQLPPAALRSMIQLPPLLLQALAWNSFPLLPAPESLNTPIGSFYPCLLRAASFCPPPQISYVEALTHNVMVFGGGTFGRYLGVD